MLAFWDGNSRQVFIQFDSSGHVVATSDNGTVIGTSTTQIRLMGWHYVEALVTVDPSAGVVRVRVDGQEILTLTGVNTRSTANTRIQAISVGSDQQFEEVYVDDLYICDSSDSVNNSFLGDVQVTALYPVNEGSSSPFSIFSRGGSDSGSNHGQLDESAPNGDTDYIESSNAPDYATFLYNLSTSGSILGTVLYAYAKVDTGTRTFALTAHSNSTDSIGATQGLTSSYAYYRQAFDTDPATSAGWLVAGLNAAEFGFEIIS